MATSLPSSAAAGAPIIPGPRPAPLLGNIPDIQPDAAVQSMMALAREYGPISGSRCQGAS
jgi:hypothetical protein